VKIGVIVFPGTWSDRDCGGVVESLGDQGAELTYLWHRDRDLKGSDCVIVPGGFSYGDHLRAGAIAATSPIMSSVTEFASAGGLVWGICNGFQILCEAHLLPGALTRNVARRFISRDVRIRIENATSAWTSGYQAGQEITVVLKSGEGAYVADRATLADLEASGRVVARYADGNPNGSAAQIAGVASAAGNVVGLMPHPEHAIDPLTGPGTDGLKFFESILTMAAAT
jgi:phosphoribosylformylglycinamidine synthase subunit PurQ / glutaminase